ncbi:FabG-like protein [Nocardia phage P3.1]|nr:FabG-like protein [Nocardia phage P3.1]
MKVLVIGGDSGIGAATVMAIREKIKELTIDPNMHEVLWTSKDMMDVRSLDSIRKWMEAHEVDGYFDHVVYSAGVNYLEWLGKLGHDGIEKSVDLLNVNLVGFLRVMDYLAWGKATPSGDLNLSAYPRSVVAVSSDAASRPLRTSSAYCASKAALDMAVKVAARELGPCGWRINAVSPGMTAPTGMSKYVDERVQKIRGWSVDQMMQYERSQEVVHGRIAPYGVGKVIADTLFGPSHLNGSIITINGGR